MKICNNKKYRTRIGQCVVIDRKRSGSKAYPVTGRIIGPLSGPRRIRWTSSGRASIDWLTPFDLVEVVND